MYIYLCKGSDKIDLPFSLRPTKSIVLSSGSSLYQSNTSDKVQDFPHGVVIVVAWWFHTLMAQVTKCYITSASQSRRICVADSAPYGHLSQMVLFVNPSLKRCPLR